ncbi:hypothetical protein KHA80_04450 [Anaerobacillus sp. HL2]|nr:hypothetical protein KHA80_04450 [Anaerobacillus sp. HL2]
MVNDDAESMVGARFRSSTFSMTDKKRRKQMARFVEPMTNMEFAQMMPTKRTMKRLRKQVMRKFS